jgi:hypothetical protein
MELGVAVAVKELINGAATAGVLLTVRMAVLVFPAASRAVTVITFVPLERVMLALHEVVPVAVPLPPRELDQLTWVTPNGPLKLSDAVLAMLSEELAAV